MNFEQFLNEAKNFKVGDTWEWHGKDWSADQKKDVDTIKKVKITKVEGSNITGQFDGESKEYIIRDANKYLKKKVNESEEITESNIKVGDTVSRKFMGEDPTQTFKVISISGGKAKLKDTKTGEENGMYLSDLVKESEELEEATKENPSVWVPGGFDKEMSKYPNNKITKEIVLKAAKKYNVDAEDAIQYVEFGWDVDLNESVNEAEASYGLSKAETKRVAETLAKAISKHDGVKCTVNSKSLEEDSFDLDIDGEEYEGGSYYINDKGEVVNAAITPHEIYGKAESSVEDFIKGLKKPIKESFLDAYDENSEELDESYSNDFASWFTGTSLNDVKHPKYGNHKVTPDQIKNAPADYKNKLFKAIEKAIKSGDITNDMIKANESEEVTESKITLKRRYTENYPASTVGKHAGVRNKIIEALKDGQLTKEEFEQLVSGLTEDSKRWLKRNAAFFNIQEDQVSLSATGKKILKSIDESGYRPMTDAERQKAQYKKNQLARLRAVDKKEEEGKRLRALQQKLHQQKMRKANESFIYESFSEFVNLTVQEDAINEANVTAEEIKAVEQALPELENLIKAKLGFKPKLKIEAMGRGMKIKSEDLTHELGKTLVKTLFKSINISIWGEKIQGEESIWFNCKLEYTHPSGGSNGVDFVWSSLWYKLDSKQWVEGRLI